jgi:hypothetical protein
LAYRRETPTGLGRQATNKAAVGVQCRVFAPFIGLISERRSGIFHRA